MAARRILISCLGTAGDLDPYLAVARHLLAAGHSVTIATLQRHADAVSQVGVRFQAGHPDWVPGAADDPLSRAFREPQHSTRILMREFVMDHLPEALAMIRPLVAAHDVTVLHPAALAARLAVEMAGRPWLSTVVTPYSLPSSLEPPLQVLPPGLRNAAPRARLAYWQDLVEPWHALRRRLGLPHLAAHLANFSTHGTLALFSPLLARDPGDWVKKVQITGFCRHVPPVEPELWQRAERFLAAGPPPVAFTLGSHSASMAGRFFQASIEAARRNGQRAIILGRSAEQIGVAESAEVACFPGLPFATLFPRTVAVVTHSGVGTMARALEAGRPILAIASPVNDQPDNARRVQRLGAALAMPLVRYDAESATAALGRLLHEPAYATAARQVARALSEEGDGAARAAAAIAALPEAGQAHGSSGPP